MPKLNFDRQRFAKDLEMHKRRKKLTLADMARDAGISKSTAGNAVRGAVCDVNTVLSLCAYLRKDINAYVIEGLPDGIKERWRGAHKDGRTVEIDRSDHNAKAVERNTDGKVLWRRNRRYGNGFHGYEDFVTEYTGKGFTETEHTTA